MKQYIPHRQLTRRMVPVLILFVMASVVLGVGLDVYDTVWWFDDLLHGLSGIILVFVGLIFVQFMNYHHKLKLTPLFMAAFVFCFATSVGVLWEIYEFGMDAGFGYTMQQWNVPPSDPMMGYGFQGSGLRDTMGDFILAWIGSVIGAAVVYWKAKNG